MMEARANGGGSTTMAALPGLRGALSKGGAGTSTFGGSSGSRANIQALVPANTYNLTTAPKKLPGSGFSRSALFKFLFPESLKNPDSASRLEIFAAFGPTDEDGLLRGGRCGAHVHTNQEIAQMAKVNCREALFKCFAPRPRSSVEAVVDMLLKVAMDQRYTEEEVQQILRRVPVKADGSMNFLQVQDAILASQKVRLERLIKLAEGGKPVAPPKERPPRVLYQSQSAADLMRITEKKKSASSMEDAIREQRRLHSYSCKLATLEDQNKSMSLRSNVLLCRTPGEVSDRWDRYCAMRKTGRSSYVGAKNWSYHQDHPLLDQRFNPSLDEGLSNKHPGVSSLLAAGAVGSSAACLLAS